MLRVYISSTYNDLEEERHAVRDAVLNLGHYPAGMENYGASDERPLDRCLEDVRSCQAYIGIIAWRYGFCPNGGEKSITQFEFEAAGDQGIPRYMFLLSEDAPWPRNRVPDGDQPRVKEFRKMLAGRFTVAFFHDAENLGKLVTQSLAVAEATVSDRPSMPDMIPYLNDRSNQESDLSDALELWEKKPNRPLVCIVHGVETEAHDKFFERLQLVMIPSLLPRGSEHADIQVHRLEWPASFRNSEEMHRRLEMSLSKEVLDSARGTCEEINTRLAQSLGPVAIHSHLITESWLQQGTTALDLYLDFWQRWPELGIGQQLLVFLFIKYQMNMSLGTYKLRQYRRTNSEIRTVLENYDFNRFPGITGKVIRELQGPTLGETEDWARSDEVAKFCDKQMLVNAVAQYYAEWEAQEKPKAIPVRIPTDQLVSKLKDIISRVLLPVGRTI